MNAAIAAVGVVEAANTAAIVAFGITSSAHTTAIAAANTALGLVSERVTLNEEDILTLNGKTQNQSSSIYETSFTGSLKINNGVSNTTILNDGTMKTGTLEPTGYNYFTKKTFFSDDGQIDSLTKLYSPGSQYIGNSILTSTMVFNTSVVDGLIKLNSKTITLYASSAINLNAPEFTINGTTFTINAETDYGNTTTSGGDTGTTSTIITSNGYFSQYV